MEKPTRLLSRFVLAGLLLALCVPNIALAQAMPWESPLRQLLQSFQTTTAQILIIMAIIGAALAFAFGEAGSIFRRAAGIVFGGAIAIGASTWAPALFGF